MAGIYAMYFTGTAGSGYAVFVMKDGVVIGADPLGGQIHGTYHNIGDEKIDVSINLTVPPGTQLVTGAIAGKEPMTQEIKATLPKTFASGNSVAVQTPIGPVNVIFKHLRDVP